jgi:hypothetical protein
MPPGSANLRRLHGPFVSEAESRKICDFLRTQGSPDYQMEILESSATGGDDSSHSGEQRDELYDEALRIVLDSGQASISMIQRRLRIGYNRSARMVEQMEREGDRHACRWRTATRGADAARFARGLATVHSPAGFGVSAGVLAKICRATKWYCCKCISTHENRTLMPARSGSCLGRTHFGGYSPGSFGPNTCGCHSR